MRHSRLGLFALACLTLLFIQQPASGKDWLPGGTYDPSVPSPASVLGYEIGTHLTDHLQMVDYIHRLARVSDRVQVIKYGESVERRVMYLLLISNPENLARLEEIRTRIERLKDPRRITAEEAEQIIQSTPPIGWINFGTDGGETAAFEASMLLAYQLAAGLDPLTEKIVNRTITIINPVACPDSHQAFATWMKAATIGREGTADPFAAEHEVPWFISSDGNHYLIDFNRDAFAQTQIESQQLARALQRWNPQIWIDNHGEPDEYYMAPFCTPMNLNYPAELRERAVQIGENAARYFDKFGWTYAKDETYDLYYPGYWDSYPAFNGAVSATYETNGGGWKNLSWEKPDGTLATLSEAIHTHFIADMASLETLADHPATFLRYFAGFYRTGIEEAEQEEFKTYVLFEDPDPGRAAELVTTLMRHGIEVYRTSVEASSDRGQTYFDRSPKSLNIPAGSYVIPVKQPKKRVLETLLEPDPRLEQAFLEEIESARRRNEKLGSDVPKERAGFYDVTAWALPLTFGVQAAFTEEAIAVRTEDRLTSAPELQGGLVGGAAAYAYLFVNDSAAAGQLAGRLLQEGFRVAITTRDFKNSGRSFPVGTFVVRVGRNPETLHLRIRELVKATGATVHPVDTAWAEEGISLGSRKIINLETPRIAVLSDEPTRAVAFGGVYTLLEQRFSLRFTALRAVYLESVDLSRYNVLILPDGSAAGYRRWIGKEGIEKLKSWVRAGGVLIGLKAGAEFTTLEDVGLVEDIRVIDEIEVSGNDEAVESELVPIEYHPGSIFRATVNNDYYLGYGYPEEIAVQFRGDKVLSATSKGANVVQFPKDSFIQGHRWETSEDTLAGKVYMADVPVGQGHVILFGDDPTFRAYWQGLDRLLINSILLAPAF
ncbi:MAG: hypothetical protein JSU96_18175 [Acidobacteriota bacterium]|nr:MAG: hypothetical protein JSU96_18175 [Acidobacteriota bacterium]